MMWIPSARRLAFHGLAIAGPLVIGLGALDPVVAQEPPGPALAAQQPAQPPPRVELAQGEAARRADDQPDIRQKGARISEQRIRAKVKARLFHQKRATLRAEADYHNARLARALAEIAVEEYEQSAFEQDLAAADGEVLLAESDLSRAEDRVEWARRMFDKGFVGVAQKVAEELALKKRSLPSSRPRPSERSWSTTRRARRSRSSEARWKRPDPWSSTNSSSGSAPRPTRPSCGPGLGASNPGKLRCRPCCAQSVIVVVWSSPGFSRSAARYYRPCRPSGPRKRPRIRPRSTTKRSLARAVSPISRGGGLSSSSSERLPSAPRPNTTTRDSLAHWPRSPSRSTNRLRSSKISPLRKARYKAPSRSCIGPLSTRPGREKCLRKAFRTAAFPRNWNSRKPGSGCNKRSRNGRSSFATPRPRRSKLSGGRSKEPTRTIWPRRPRGTERRPAWPSWNAILISRNPAYEPALLGNESRANRSRSDERLLRSVRRGWAWWHLSGRLARREDSLTAQRKPGTISSPES